MHTMTKQDGDEGAHAWYMLMTPQRIIKKSNRNLKKGIPGNAVRGATGNNISNHLNLKLYQQRLHLCSSKTLGFGVGSPQD